MKRFLTMICFLGLPFNVSANTIAVPCNGAAVLLNIIDRPTAADSACVAPFEKVVIESGYQYQQLSHSAGQQQNFPEAEIRVGLSANNEFVVVVANYIHQTMAPYSGTTATTLGVKHEIDYTSQAVLGAEALFTLPNGSAAFGNKGIGAALNGMLSYSLNAQFNLSMMLGVTSQTQSSHDGGGRFVSINPDVVFTYAPIAKLNLYAEVYGQSKTAPGNRNGFNMDGGIIYLLLSNFSVDAEIGQRIAGRLGGFNHYIGVGASVIF